MPKLMEKPKPKVDVARVAAELQNLQRQRAVVLKSRNMTVNRLQAIVAGTLGYYAGMPAKERPKKFVEAAQLIQAIEAGRADHPYASIVLVTMVGVNAFNASKDTLEKEMKKQAKLLPVAPWVEADDQRGFGVLFLAIVIGETGDLANYANPAKVWRRLSCAPYTFDGQTRMGATWKGGKEGKLPASEWEQFGYSPRRRSIAYLIGEGLVRQNCLKDKDTEEVVWMGPYRARYDQAKAAFKANHPEYSDLRCHRHGMLLATKLLLKNLWVQWNR
jgi:hypothetical protein